jgi:hypothetical protein
LDRTYGGHVPGNQALNCPTAKEADMTTPVLERLGDTDWIVADPADDIRDRPVRDRDGDRIGTVEELLVDRAEREVRFLVVEHGGFLGIGATASFIPVEAVSGIDDAGVQVDLSGRQVAEAPRYNPAVTDEPDLYERLYGYYGYAPYWLPGTGPAGAGMPGRFR